MFFFLFFYAEISQGKKIHRKQQKGETDDKKMRKKLPTFFKDDWTWSDQTISGNFGTN